MIYKQKLGGKRTEGLDALDSRNIISLHQVI